MIFRVASAHEEGVERRYSVETIEFLGDDDGNLRALRGHEVETVVGDDGRPSFRPVPGSEFELECQLAFLAMGFTGAQREGLIDALGADVDARGNVARDDEWMSSVDGVFVAGDMGRGQSLIVWAIAEGRSVAASVDRYLMGATDLPAPLTTRTVALR